MIRMYLAFLLVWAFVFFGISFFWHSTKSEKLNFFRIGIYSLLTALIAFAILVCIVVLF
jgi:predicted membrane channel-forming protein YqfA (hemolysin III family)